MVDLECDNYVSPGERYARSGMAIGRGQGLSVRDHFAVQALKGILSGGSDCGNDPQATVGKAYRYADEMINRRATPCSKD